MTTKIRKAIENNLGSMRRARCVKRSGGLLATLPLPIAVLRLIPAETVDTWVPWFNTTLAINIVIAIVLSGVVLYITGVALFAAAQGKIAALLKFRRDFLQIKETPSALVARLRALGARGEAAGTFISAETLTLLLDANPDYVQAWGKPIVVPAAGNVPEHTDYEDIGFFVVAPLNAAGVKAMRPDGGGVRCIQNNRDLRVEHVEKVPKQALGLYIIELYGGSNMSRGTAEGRLFEYLNEDFGGSLSDSAFRIFARPATDLGTRIVGQHSFCNLGTTPKDMHVWQTIEEDQGLCGFVLSLFSAK